MADADVADQALHVPGVEHVAYQAVVLAQEQPPLVTGYNAGSILAAMLKDGKRVVQRLIDVRLTDDTNDATHATQPLRSQARAGKPAGPEGHRL
ncbi:hypothetical protein D3C81_1043230 [compost metagenome]